jgi:hypothetical protein
MSILNCRDLAIQNAGSSKPSGNEPIEFKIVQSTVGQEKCGLLRLDQIAITSVLNDRTIYNHHRDIAPRNKESGIASNDTIRNGCMRTKLKHGKPQDRVIAKTAL